MKKAFIRFLHSMGLGKSFDIEKWAKEEYGVVEAPNPIVYKSFAETEEERCKKVIQEARDNAQRSMKERDETVRDAKIDLLLKRIDDLKDRPLTVDDRLELDQLIYGVAYYRTVDGVKERLDPTTMTILHSRYLPSRISPLSYWEYLTQR